MPRAAMRTAGFQSIGALIGTCPSLAARQSKPIKCRRLSAPPCTRKEMLVLSSNLADAAGVEGDFSAGGGGARQDCTAWSNFGVFFVRATIDRPSGDQTGMVA